LPYLKRQLSILRQAILAMPRESDTGGFRKLDPRTPAANSHRMSAFHHDVTAA
jgi:hypothetical protein